MRQAQGLIAEARRHLRENWRSKGFYGATTLADAMRAGCERHANTRVLFHSDERPADTTLGAMYAQSRKLAGALHTVGIKQGDVIAIQTPNWLEGALIYQAAMILGAVIVPVIHIYGPREVSFILRQSQARLFVVPGHWRNIDYFERLACLDRPATLEHILVIDDDPPRDMLGWAQVLDKACDPPPQGAGDADACCLLIYTSGTTAEPKGVRHSHNTLLAEMRSQRAYLGDADLKSSLSPWPSGHIAGVLGILRMYLNGTRAILMDVWNAAEAARLVERFQVGQMSGTPYYLASLLDAADAGRHDLSSLSGFMTGAASVPPSLLARAERYGIFPYRCYGSTEHPTVTCGLPSDPAFLRAFTDGRAIPPSRVRIVDDDGHDVPLGQDGEIVTDGPEQFLGYNNPAHDVEAFLPDGWFRTGDIGRLDDNGCLTVTDRKKDIIIRGGENISSKEVEDLLARHPSVKEAAVVAMPDERLGERVCAFVIVQPEQRLDLSEIDRHFKTLGVARQKTPEHLVIVDDLPRTAAGKVKKFELRAQLKAGAVLGAKP